MIAIDTAQPYAPGYVELSHELFGALAKIAEGNPDAESIRAGAEYHSDRRDADVWHVLADTERGSFRYVITDKAELLGVEWGEPADGDGDDWDWFPFDREAIDSDTWQVRA